MVTIVLADDHAVLRAGIRLLLDQEAGIATVGEAGTAQGAVEQASEHTPDIVLMDVSMPGGNGIDAIPLVLEASPRSRVLMLSMHDDAAYVHRAFSAGASGYVLKDAADTELVAAIREVAGGATYVNPALGARMIAAENKDRAEALGDPLSTREHDVLELLALGHTNHEIAEHLFISVRTAETHRAHIMRKLALRSRAELVRYALEHRLLDASA